MSPLFIIFALTLLVAQFALPRRLAFAPLLIAACHLPHIVPVVELGGLKFSIFRILILAGLLRAACEGVVTWSSRQLPDLLMAAWAGWAILSSFGHKLGEHNPLTLRLSLAFDIFGTYLYARAYLRSPVDMVRFSKCLALALIPLAIMMAIEQTTGRNVYAALGARVQEAWVREGRVRAAGPFGVAILAGTAGAASVPLLAMLYQRHRRFAIAGILASVMIVVCSASSGPIMTLVAGVGALMLWRMRTHLRHVQISAILALVALSLVMKAPVWYLMARIDITGGSTGWHRAELITQALKHLDRWWLVGTDYTRDWLPYGITWSKDQVDITNYYLKMGVIGGLPLMVAFIAILLRAYQHLGHGMLALRREENADEFVLWCVGAALFSHSFTFLSVAYFDQSYVFFFLVLGSVVGISGASMQQRLAALSSAASSSAGSSLRHGNSLN